LILTWKRISAIIFDCYSQLQAGPRSSFIYSNGGTNWLANALTNIYRQGLRRLTTDRLFTPPGVTGNDIRWRTPAHFFNDLVDGLPATEFNGGMMGNVNATARLGYLYLNRGNWDGRQIISSAWADRRPSPTTRNCRYSWSSCMGPCGGTTASAGLRAARRTRPSLPG
jgi:CubicO group peptidase (beta-lactamase class C family)